MSRGNCEVLRSMSASGKKHFEMQTSGKKNPDSLHDQELSLGSYFSHQVSTQLRKTALLSSSSHTENRASSLTLYLYPQLASHPDKSYETQEEPSSSLRPGRGTTQAGQRAKVGAGRSELESRPTSVCLVAIAQVC